MLLTQQLRLVVAYIYLMNSSPGTTISGSLHQLAITSVLKTKVVMIPLTAMLILVMARLQLLPLIAVRLTSPGMPE